MWYCEINIVTVYRIGLVKLKSLRKKERRHVRDTTKEVMKAKDPLKKKRQGSSIIYLTINDCTLIFIDS